MKWRILHLYIGERVLPKKVLQCYTPYSCGFEHQNRCYGLCYNPGLKCYMEEI
uniref:Uncharacterized protein n=1 Tax=Myoviridae sp. ct5kl10 TaxID=2826615 RepID=A0A8S5N7L6_9CAUD|nr:MAG TPA: hypothetical protein [Myoviridae sp. ct5kl10]